MQGAIVIAVAGAVLLGWGWLLRQSSARGDDEYARGLGLMSRVAIPVGAGVLAVGLIACLGSLIG